MKQMRSCKFVGSMLLFFCIVFSGQQINAMSPLDDDGYTEFSVDDSSHPIQTRSKRQEKPWTIMIYIAGANDLEPFVWPNIRQLARIGSNDFCNIIVQLNEKNKNKPTQRYLIVKNKAILLNPEEAQAGIKLDSGNEKTLIDFCSFCIDEYPSKQTSLILWNHGAGVIDPGISKTTNVLEEFFSFNPDSLMLEINRSIEFLETIILKDKRGICFDEIYKSYLTNAKIVKALNTVTKKIGKPIDLLGLDACLMAMHEFGVLVKPYCRMMVASQEVELGWGWNYATALARFEHGTLSPKELAGEIVKSYGNAYKDITPDYTLSACNLEKINKLDDNISEVAGLLVECLRHQKHDSVHTTVQYCRSRKQCTHFEEPSYIDLGHFFKNLITHIDRIDLESDKSFLKKELVSKLKKSLVTIEQVVFAKANGKNLSSATGLSIYFPHQTKFIHSSYQSSTFARDNQWINFLKTFMKK